MLLSRCLVCYSVMTLELDFVEVEVVISPVIGFESHTIDKLSEMMILSAGLSAIQSRAFGMAKHSS